MRATLPLIAIAAAASLLSAGAQEPAPAISAEQKKLVDYALRFTGVPYKYGAQSPAAFDCSGFVQYVYRNAVGMELPRSARYYLTVGVAADPKATQAGDIFVYNTVGSGASHVALYLGNGTVIHAISEGPKTGVVVSAVTERYWSARLMAVRRVLSPARQAEAEGREAGQTGTHGQAVAGASSQPPAPKEAAVAELGFSIPDKPEKSTERIPIAPGTQIVFTVSNGTGRAGTFIVYLYSIDAASYKLDELHRQKVDLAAGESYALPPWTFQKPGLYRLMVKGDWGRVLLERSYVVEP
ncbi:MAG: C40 family peptidase [Spirochaetia bacterium]|nr:C40 family peptidase [Spirochaetia bacterium]